MSPAAFTAESALTDDALGLAIAPALTPTGLIAAPSFFHGFAVHPQVLARGLVTLADVTATRYFQYTPTAFRDPVLTAHGDRLRAECFSACNGVYARLDLLAGGFDGGEISRGTTNVDIGPGTRSALTRVGRAQLLHLDIGADGLRVSSPDSTAVERPVQMPDRWVRALGNAAELQRGLVAAFTVGPAGTREFVASLPPATASARSAWLVASGAGVRVSARPRAGAVHIAGLHRLSAAKRLLTHVRGMTVYGPAEAGPGSDTGQGGPALVEFDLPAARLVLGLTSEPWRGHSGEGSLLEALASPDVAEDADLVSALLAFEPVIDVPRLARQAGRPEGAVRAALAVLAVSGRVGWDAHDGAYFHRELPQDPDRVAKDNPRLMAARSLAERGAVRAGPASGEWVVAGSGSAGASAGGLFANGADGGYVVRLSPAGDRCTCPWYLAHAGGRGPCKHVLAARLVQEAR